MKRLLKQIEQLDKSDISKLNEFDLEILKAFKPNSFCKICYLHKSICKCQKEPKKQHPKYPNF